MKRSNATPPPPFPYQVTGAEFLAQRLGAYLGDDPGAGKTRQIIDAADQIGAQRILVICPASLRVNWAREFTKFSRYVRPVCIPETKDFVPPTGPLVCLVNYEKVIRPELHWLLREMAWDVLACDEGHKLKEPTTKVTRAVLGQMGLYLNARHVWPASGTPAPNHAGELYPVLASLHPTATRGMEYHEWLRHYCHVVPGTYKDRVMGHKDTIGQLKTDLAGFMIRRRRSEVLADLPPLTVADMTVQNDDALASIEAAASEDPLLAGLVGAEVEEAVERELEEAEMATVRRLAGEAKAHALVDVVADELDNGKGKMVLMCWHRSTMDVLEQGLSRFGVARIDGSTKNRQLQVDKFQNSDYTTGCRVFIGQILAAGTGHTLIAASEMIVVEPSWVPGENFQAMLRIHRIGQINPCLIRFAALSGSIDEMIMGVQARKARLLAELL